MLKVLCTVFDEKSGIYGAPFTSHNEATAERDFSYVVINDTSSDLYRNPIDYHLFLIAEYDDTTGEINTKTRKLIVSAANLIHRQEKNNA